MFPRLVRQIPRFSTRLQVLQHVAQFGRISPLPHRHVHHTLVHRFGHFRHNNRSLCLDSSPETRYVCYRSQRSSRTYPWLTQQTSTGAHPLKPKPICEPCTLFIVWIWCRITSRISGMLSIQTIPVSLLSPDRPQILALSGKPSSRPPIVDLANCISKGIGLIVCGQVAQVMMNRRLQIIFNAFVIQGSLSQRARNNLIQDANNWLLKRNVKAFYNLVEEESLSRGVKAMIQVKLEFVIAMTCQMTTTVAVRRNGQIEAQHSDARHEDWLVDLRSAPTARLLQHDSVRLVLCNTYHFIAPHTTFDNLQLCVRQTLVSRIDMLTQRTRLFAIRKNIRDNGRPGWQRADRVSP